MNLAPCVTLHYDAPNAESLLDIDTNRIKMFVPNWEKKNKEMHADNQTGVAVYLFTIKTEMESNMTPLPCYLFVYKNHLEKSE